MINIDEILNNDILWQMSTAEKASILYMLNKLPGRKVAVEVGSYKGGFTRVLSRYFNKVYSCDLDHSYLVDKEQYKNVTWVTGDSKETLPALISRINSDKEDVSFILIDGDHSYETVIQDIHNVLNYKPRGETILLIHDSWYGPSREAINKANWSGSPYVDYVEKDFVPGDVVYSEEGKIFVGGLALISISPKKRKGDIEIRQTHDYMYRVCKKLLDESNEVAPDE